MSEIKTIVVLKFRYLNSKWHSQIIASTNQIPLVGNRAWSVSVVFVRRFIRKVRDIPWSKRVEIYGHVVTWCFGASGIPCGRPTGSPRAIIVVWRHVSNIWSSAPLVHRCLTSIHWRLASVHWRLASIHWRLRTVSWCPGSSTTSWHDCAVWCAVTAKITNTLLVIKTN